MTEAWDSGNAPRPGDPETQAHWRSWRGRKQRTQHMGRARGGSSAHRGGTEQRLGMKTQSLKRE